MMGGGADVEDAGERMLELELVLELVLEVELNEFI